MKEDNTILGLATIRRNRAITLDQIASATKISVRFLDAIERGDFRRLPGGIYNTSYIRQYARAIDYDECALLEFYNRQLASERTPAAPTSGKGGFTTFRPASGIVGS